jgi:hypothetical protein
VVPAADFGLTAGGAVYDRTDHSDLSSTPEVLWVPAYGQKDIPRIRASRSAAQAAQTPGESAGVTTRLPRRLRGRATANIQIRFIVKTRIPFS